MRFCCARRAILCKICYFMYPRQRLTWPFEMHFYLHLNPFETYPFRSRGVSSESESGSTGSPADLGRLVQEATKRRRALTRIGFSFGGSLTNIQAKRLRERSAGLKESGDDLVAEKLAGQGAEALEALAGALSFLDDRFLR
mmetsp:Transcript_13308/g.28235  ORF Transcript_13308/g.28235 Transcript_13308/m.28235 type:complete len:141 (+) Transcript_13308:1180-1602(+)